MATSPFFFKQFTLPDGTPARNGWLLAFAAGSPSYKDIWQDAALTIPAPNPLQFDGSGICPQFFTESGRYDFRACKPDRTTPGQPGEQFFSCQDIDGDSAGTYTLQTATTTRLGGIKPDGTTITVDQVTGIASATGGGGPQYYNANPSVLNDLLSEVGIFPEQPLTPFAASGTRAYNPLVGAKLSAYGSFEASDTDHSVNLAILIFDKDGLLVNGHQTAQVGILSTTGRKSFAIEASILPAGQYPDGWVWNLFQYRARLDSSEIIFDGIAYAYEQFKNGPYTLGIGTIVGGNRNQATLNRFLIERLT